MLTLQICIFYICLVFLRAAVHHPASTHTLCMLSAFIPILAGSVAVRTINYTFTIQHLQNLKNCGANTIFMLSATALAFIAYKRATMKRVETAQISTGARTHRRAPRHILQAFVVYLLPLLICITVEKTNINIIYIYTLKNKINYCYVFLF